METNETLTLQEIEQLCKAYSDCHLSRLQEKELELVLMCSDLSSPVIDEVRTLMGLSSMMSAGKPVADNQTKRKLRIFRYTGVAVCVAILALSAVYLYKAFNAGGEIQDVYACVDGKVLTGSVAQTVAIDTQLETMDMLRSIIDDLEYEQRFTEQCINSLNK